MALRLVRETSSTPNITNKDDTIMARYAYGGYNGVVKALGNECEYSADSGIFKVLDGRIIIDGWEIDIDGAGWIIDFSSITGVQYHSIYAEINVAIESVKLDSTYLTGSYPEIDKGDDLTAVPNGTARLLLYNVKVDNGIITDVQPRFAIIPYLAQKVLDTENNLSKLQTSLKNGDLIPKIAEYASSDTSKGTIEDRLTKLGFKSGAIGFISPVATAPANSVVRQGNYCIMRFDISFSDEISITSEDQYLSVGFTPTEFKPATDTVCYAIAIITNDVISKEVPCQVYLNGGSGNIGINRIMLLPAEYVQGWRIQAVSLKSMGYEAKPL